MHYHLFIWLSGCIDCPGKEDRDNESEIVPSCVEILDVIAEKKLISMIFISYKYIYSILKVHPTFNFVKYLYPYPKVST